MGRRVQLPEQETNLLLTSALILLISIVLAAVAYFAFALEILDPPVTSDVPGRMGSSSSDSSGIASPGGTGLEDTSDSAVGDIIFPGFVDFSITSGQDTLELVNDSRNAVSFTFTITDEEGQVLHSTEAIAPGERESWSVTEAYEPGTGTHEITVTTAAFGLDDDREYNGVSTTITVDMG